MNKHETIKFGDIIYIEYHNQNQPKKSRIVLTSTGFELNNRSYIYPKIIPDNQEIYLKDFEDNLFIIFPTMKNEYLQNKSKIDEKIMLIKSKVGLNNLNDDFTIKKDLSQLISTFQKTKEDVYLENEKFIEQQFNKMPLKYNENFILIHFKSHLFVTKCDNRDIDEKDDTFLSKNKLKLTNEYSDDCIFLFSTYNDDYDVKADYVFTNQNLYIRKKEKNMWANNQFLIITNDEEKSKKNYTQKTVLYGNTTTINNTSSSNNNNNNNNEINNINNTNNINNDENNNNNVVIQNYNFLQFNDTKAEPFQIKICSNYINTSSANLSFANPIWICAHNLDRYLTLTPIIKKEETLNQNNSENDSFNYKNNNNTDNNSINNDNNNFIINTNTNNNNNNNSSNDSMSNSINNISNINNNNYRDSSLNDYQISLNKIDREKTMNNIYGLFFIEQVQKDSNYFDLNEIRMSPKVEYNKKIRFRHVATKKYLGFKFSHDDKLKNFGSLTLEENPNEKTCTWIFMESYYIINKNNYEKVKNEGIKKPNKNEYMITYNNITSDNKKENQPVKKKEILRIFHLETKRFLSFNNANIINENDSDSQTIFIDNLTLNKNPNDIDLVKLLPSNENQSWEMHLILYFNKVLEDQISNCKKINLSKIIKQKMGNETDKLEIIPENSNNINNTLNRNFSVNKKDKESNNINKLNNILKIIKELHKCFESLRDFCLNEFSLKYDISVSPGNPIYYRQEFLESQGFLAKTIDFLHVARQLLSEQKFIQNIEKNNSNNNKNKITSYIRTPSNKPKTPGLTILSKQSIKKKRYFKNSNLNDINDIFNEIKKSIQAAFEFISAICKNHQNNKKKVFDNKEFFWDYLLEYKEAAICLMDIIKDNETYMNELIKIKKEEKNIIDKIIDYLNNSEKYDNNILKLLSGLMKSGEKGITSNQQYIFDSIFQDFQDKFLIKITPQFNDTQFKIVYKDQNKNFIERNLIEFCSIKNSLNDYEKNVVIYLSDELNLFANLCFARNYVCIEKIRTLFPLDHLIYHISNIELHEEILAGLINILNFVYIDIEPHFQIIYPTMIKVVNENLSIERINRFTIQTYIPLDKLNLILCLSLFNLNNIKFGKFLVNSANINLIYNIIQFRLYENVEFKNFGISEVINIQLDRKLHNLKEEVTNFVIQGEKTLITNYNNINKIDNNNTISFFDKIGYKFVEYNFNQEIASEYLIFVIDHINEFFLERVIIDNIDSNMENKNIIVQNFKQASQNDMLTQNNINYLVRKLIDLKLILTSGKNGNLNSPNDLTDRRNVFIDIMEQISKVIDFIIDIKKEDMINKILENLLNANDKLYNKIIEKINNKEYVNYNINILGFNNNNNNDEINNNNNNHNSEITLYEICEMEFLKNFDFKEILMENKYYLYQVFNNLHLKYKKNKNLLKNKNNTEEIENNYLIDYPTSNIKKNNINEFYISYNNEYLNSISFKILQNLIERILEINVEEKLTKILVTMFTRLHSQKRELVDCLKNITLLYEPQDLDKYYKCNKLISKLALLTEKTEKWMSVDTVPKLNSLGFVNNNNNNINNSSYINNNHNNKNEENDIYLISSNNSNNNNISNNENNNETSKDFNNALNSLSKLIDMCYIKNSKIYKKQNSLLLIQNIFFSFNLNEVLFGLLREIYQEYSDDSKEENSLNKSIENSFSKEENSFEKKFENEENNFSENKKNDDDESLKYENYKNCLEILIKKIFKLFQCLIHNAPENISKISNTIDFFRDFKSFYNIGYINLIGEIISKTNEIDNENLKFIKEIIINKEFTEKSFKNVFDNFDSNFDDEVKNFNVDTNKNKKNNNNDDNNIITNTNEENENSKEQKKTFGGMLKDFKKNNKDIIVERKKLSKKEYLFEIKKCCQTLTIVKRLILILKNDNNYIIENFKKIMKIFPLFQNSIDININDIFDTKDYKISYYRYKLLYLLIKIGYRLIRTNDKLKVTILKLFPIKNLYEKILNLKFDIKKLNVLESIINFYNYSINHNESSFVENNILFQLKAFYKTKFNAFLLFSMIGQEQLMKINYLKTNINDYFNILQDDINQYNEINNYLYKIYQNRINITTSNNNDINKKEKNKNNINNNENIIIIIFKKCAFTFFFKGFFPIIYQLTSLFKKDLYKNQNEYKKSLDTYISIMRHWKKIFLELINNNNEYYKKILIYINFKKSNFKDFFYKFEIPKIETLNLNEPKTNTLFTHILKKNNINNINFNSISIHNDKTDQKYFSIMFTEDFIKRIENNKRITKSVIKEIKILDKQLQSKINFHRVIQFYINENSNNAIVDEILNQENNFHLFNIFIKFIQENYLSFNYYPQIKFLIDLFAYFIEVKPEILKPSNKNDLTIQNNFYFSEKFSELNDIFMKHCQKLFLNNSSIEVFLKLICEGNSIFNENIFPSLLHFFNNVLEGGNTDSQQKFYQLFVNFSNSDIFFNYIYNMFQIDIYQNLQNDISLKNPKKDYDNLDYIVSILKFLQLLTENHFINLQDFLREQPNKRSSYNFIIKLVDYMNMLLGKLGNIFETNQIMTKYITELYYKRLLAVIETLCEFLQGPCKINQEKIINNTKIIEIVDKILRETELSNKDENNNNKKNKSIFSHVEKNKKDKEKNEEDDEDDMSYLEENYENINEEELEKLQNQQQNNNLNQFKIFYLLTNYQKSLLIYKISLVLLALIEGRQKKDDVIKKILRDFDYKLIYDKISELYLKLKNNMEFFLYGIEIDENDLINNEKIVSEGAFNLYFFIIYLAEIETEETEFKKLSKSLMKESHKLSKVEKENLMEMTSNFEIIKDAMNLFKENSLSIEIVKQKDILKVFCPKLSFFKNLSDEMIKNFEEKANRSTLQTKLNSILGESEQMYLTLKQLYKLESLFRKAGPFKFLFIYPNVIETICLLLGFIMNFCIFFGFNMEKVNDKENVDLFDFGKEASDTILRIIGIILTIFSALIFVEFLTRKAPIIFRKIYRSYLKDVYEDKIKKMNELEIRRIDKILKFNGISNLFKKLGIYLNLLINPTVLYALSYIIFSILAMSYHYFFFSFHLVEFIISQPILKNVLRSVYEPLEQLVYIFIFFFILVYFYSLIIFYYFQKDMPEYSCQSVIDCFASIYSNTFSSGGNLGNFISEQGNDDNSEGKITRYLLDISYTIIMVWLVFQMVSGLIVDTFKNLRNDSDEIENDKKNICFICGLDRENIEKYYLGKDGFNKHLEDHKITNYLFYIFYLEEKDHNEYTGIESYVKDEIDKESIAWFPQGRCLKKEDWEMKHKNNYSIKK